MSSRSGIHHISVTCPNHHFLRLPRNLLRNRSNTSHLWEIGLRASGLRTSLAILLTLERDRHPQDHQC